MKTGVIIQARMSSTRLPGKVAKELPYGGGITVLEQVVRRMKKCSLADEVIVATTTGRDDDLVVRLARKAGAKTFRGSREDVLARYYGAAGKYRLDTVVRITSDCPCADPALVDSLLRLHARRGADYTANVVKLTYPDGFDAEVFSFAALQRAHRQGRTRPEREHVTFYIRSRPAEFKIASLQAPAGQRRPDLRVTLDTPDDYLLLCAVYDNLYARGGTFGFAEVMDLFLRKPWLEEINRRSAAKKVTATQSDEVREALRVLKLQELHRAAALLAAKAGKKR
ncbi:MAG: glycosyltransferase family protein [Elusimicrobiales bacterium]|nr:glycosyltransferase family protein [Elusimicrobiales bacterium]